MEKQDVIKRFKDLCTNPDFRLFGGELVSSREIAVKTQYNRAVWEIGDDRGLIRISCNNAPVYSMVIFHTIKSVKAQGLINGTQEYQITWQEYDELRDAYFGNFYPDVPYLQSIGALG